MVRRFRAVNHAVLAGNVKRNARDSTAVAVEYRAGLAAHGFKPPWRNSAACKALRRKRLGHVSEHQTTDGSRVFDADDLDGSIAKKRRHVAGNPSQQEALGTRWRQPETL